MITETEVEVDVDLDKPLICEATCPTTCAELATWFGKYTCTTCGLMKRVICDYHARQLVVRTPGAKGIKHVYCGTRIPQEIANPVVVRI
jgi:hypothetical protein